MIVMTSLLTMDVVTLRNALMRGAVWWCDEMRAMAPRRWNGAERNRMRPVIQRDGDVYRLIGGDGPSANAFADAASFPGHAGEVTLCLVPSLGLQRTMVLPPLSNADLRSVIALDMDRLTPFFADQVLFDILPLSRDPSEVRVMLGIVRKEDGAAAVEHARSRGFTPVEVALPDDQGRAFIHFRDLDVLGKADSARWTPRRAWAAFACLLLLNAGLFLFGQVSEIEDLRHRVELSRPKALAAQKIRVSVEAENVRRAELLGLKHRNDPLPLLAAVTDRLPDGAWVQRLEWDGSQLRLKGWSSGGVDILGLIEADPLLGDVHQESTTIVPGNGRMPFEIVAKRENGGGA